MKDAADPPRATEPRIFPAGLAEGELQGPTSPETGLKSKVVRG